MAPELPFPVIYFGTLLAAFLYDPSAILSSLPSWEAHMQSKLIPSHTSLPLVLLSLGAITPALGQWRDLLKRRLFSPLAASWAGLRPGEAKHDKFMEQAWLAVHYTLLTGLELGVLAGKPWWPPVLGVEQRRALSAPQAERERDQEDVGLRAFYSIQLGFYALELVTLVCTPKGRRRSDFGVYFFHHVYTVLLLMGSWMSFHHRIGSLVLFLHDIGDIFLPIGKCYSYAEEHIRKTCTPQQFVWHKNVGTCFFALFIVLFAVPRLFFFGALIYQGPTEFKWYSCCGLGPDGQSCGPCEAGPMWSTGLLSILALLYPMHVFWFYLIAKMAVRVLVGKFDDVRSDDEGEDVGEGGGAQNGSPKKNKKKD